MLLLLLKLYAVQGLFIPNCTRKIVTCDYLLIIYAQKFQTNSKQFLFCLARLTRSAYKNPIGPKNDNGLLACFMFAGKKKEKEQVFKSAYL